MPHAWTPAPLTAFIPKRTRHRSKARTCSLLTRLSVLTAALACRSVRFPPSLLSTTCRKNGKSLLTRTPSITADNLKHRLKDAQPRCCAFLRLDTRAVISAANERRPGVVPDHA